MRRGYLFWGSALVLLSILFFLKALGLIEDVLGFFWPAATLLLGVWTLIFVYVPRFSKEEGDTLSIDLQNAKEARLDLDHGAGRVEIKAGAEAGKALTGSKGLGLSVSTKMKEECLDIDLDAGPTFIPFIGPSSGTWNFKLNRDIPWKMDIDSGASLINIDLSDLLVPYFKMDTGASNVDITLPTRPGNSLMDMEAGAASLSIHVPEATAIRLRVKEGVSALSIDNKRFPTITSGIYQSPGYDTAACKVEMSIEAGVGSIKIL